VRERVVSALALSPDDDVALHILGRWEYEMACLGFAVRMVVKVVYGGLESPGSFQEAHKCLARAIELNPDRLVHRVVMARILLKLGKKEEAVEQLEAASRLRIEDVNAEVSSDALPCSNSHSLSLQHERAEAMRMLVKLNRPMPPSFPTALVMETAPAACLA
jgi:tetratricopeptide (TPR) repeat protein